MRILLFMMLGIVLQSCAYSRLENAIKGIVITKYERVNNRQLIIHKKISQMDAKNVSMSKVLKVSNQNDAITFCGNHGNIQSIKEEMDWYIAGMKRKGSSIHHISGLEVFVEITCHDRPL